MSAQGNRRFATRLERLGGESAYAVSDEAGKLAAAGKKIYAFHIGDLNFDSPEGVTAAAKKALDEHKTHYCSASGIMPLREAVANLVSRERGVKYSLDEVSIQPGGKSVIGKFLLSCMEPGDEVLYPSPGYPIYESLIKFHGGVAKPYIYREDEKGMVLDMAQLKSQITPRTRILIYNNLQNPTGHCSSREEMALLAELAVKNDWWVLSDEAYFHLVYGKDHGDSIVSLPGMRERTLILVTSSKSWAMTGWRMGAAVGPEPLIKWINAFNVNDEGCTATFVQWAALNAFSDMHNSDFTRKMRNTLQSRRDLLHQLVNEIPGFSAKLPTATFYLWVNATEAFRILGCTQYEEFRKRILYDTGVSFCTREHFGASLPTDVGKYIRLAYSGIDEKEIREACKVLKDYMIKRKAALDSAPRKLPKVFITRQIPANGLKMLDGVVDYEVWPEEEGPPRDVLLAKVRDCDGLVTLLTDKVDEELLKAAPRCKIITQLAVGYNNVDVPACTKYGVAITNTPGVLTDTTVETTFALLFAASRRIVESDKYVRDGKWKVSWHPLMMLGQDLSNHTLGIVGLGRIGLKVAVVAKTFGAHVVYFDVSRNIDAEKQHGVKYLPMDELCRQADFISINCLLSPETHHLINEKNLALMKPNCVLVNSARGPIVDQKALAKALKARRIFAAGLDVFEVEPISESDELLKLDNVVLLPHLGSASLTTRQAMARLVAENQIAFWSGKMPPNVLNPEVVQRSKL